MKTKTCVDCGKKFTLTESELVFYHKKGLSEPKRCAACREKKQERISVKESAPIKSSAWFFGSGICFLLSYFSFHDEKNICLSLGLFFLAVPLFLLGIFFASQRQTFALKKCSQESLVVAQQLKNAYLFSNTERLKEHFQKHAIETSTKTPIEYVRKANAVIQNPKAIHKIEKEDGDDVYFLEKTGEIVFLSKYKKIRTYYIATKDYFNRT